jgi:O-antigen/teichoic acid export membrane protein
MGDHNTVQRLARNTLLLSAAQVSRVFFNTVLSWFIARWMGIEDFGKYGVLTAYFGVFYALAVMGAPRLVVREMARSRTAAGDYDIAQQQRWFHITWLNQLIGSVIGVVMMLVVAHLLNHPADTRQALVVVSIALIPAAISSAMEIALQAVEKMEYIAITHIVAGGVQLAGSLIALWLGHGLLMLAWMMVVWQGTIALMQILITLRLGFWHRFRWYGQESFLLFRESFEFFLLSLSAVVFSRLDVLILSQVVGEAAVGLYNAAYLVVRGVNLIAASYGQAIYPTLSHFYKQSRAQFEQLMFKSLLWGMLGMLLVALGLSIHAEWIIQLVYAKEEYSLAARILAIEAIFVAIFFWNSVLSRGLMAGDMQSRSVVVSTVKLVMALGYYGAFTYWWGVTGAAIATVVSMLTGAALNYYFLNKYVYRLDAMTLLVKPLMVAIVSAGLWFLLYDWGWALAAVVGFGVYGGLAWSLRLVSGEDIVLLKRLVTR